MRFARGFIAVALLASACGSASSNDASTVETTTTTTTSASRTLDSPADSLTTTDPPEKIVSTSEDEPAVLDPVDSSTEPPTSTSASLAPESSVSSTTASTSTASTLTTPSSTTTSSSSTTPTTTTTAASTSAPERIDLPDAVGSAEGIAVDSTTGRVFVGELNNGNVWVGLLDEAPYTLFASGSAAGRSTALGMAVDERRRRLYVVSPANGRVDVLNLDSGDLIAAIALPVGSGSLANDVIVANDGTAYVTDTGRPHIYRITAGGTSAELWVDYSATTAVNTSARTQHGNGIVATSSYLLVAYMIEGELLRVDRASGDVTRVSISGAPAAGRDGLVLCGSRLYGVDIASFAGGTETVWITQLSGDGTSGSAAGMIRSESFSSATTAAALDGSLVVVNAQFGVSPPQKPFWLTVVDAPC